MKVSLKCADIYKKVKAANLVTKHANLYQEQYDENDPMNPQFLAAYNDDIFNDVYSLGNRYYDSQDYIDYINYLRSLEQPQAQEGAEQPVPTADTPKPDQEQVVGDDELNAAGMTPSEYLSLYDSPEQRMPLELGAGAYNLYDNMGNMKLSHEKVAEVLNEIVKVGKVHQEVVKMASNGDKLAPEVNAINKDYFVQLIGKLI